MSITTADIPSLFPSNSSHCLQPFCTAATTCVLHQPHRPRSENPRFSHKRGGSRRAIFATCARDLTSSQLPVSPVPALSALTETVLAVPLWRRAVVAEPEPVRPAAAETSVLGGACVCRGVSRVSRVFEESRKRGELCCAVLQRLAAAQSRPIRFVPIKPHIISPISTASIRNS